MHVTLLLSCGHAHHEREARSPFRPGSRAGLRALDALGFLIVSRAIWVLFLSILVIQNGLKNIVNKQILTEGGGGGGRLLLRPLWIRHCDVNPGSGVIVFVLFFLVSLFLFFNVLDRPAPSTSYRPHQSTENPTGTTGKCPCCQMPSPPRLVTFYHVNFTSRPRSPSWRCVYFRRNASSNLQSVGLRDPPFRRNTSKSRIVTLLDANVNKINANSYWE